MLMDCDPEAKVCIEAFSDNQANLVKQYHTDTGDCVYIADSTDYLDGEESLKEYESEGSYTLDLFLEDEIPFRLKEIHGVSDEDAEEVKEEILDELCLMRGGAFNFFDYDAFDSFITDILDEHGIAYGG